MVKTKLSKKKIDKPSKSKTETKETETSNNLVSVEVKKLSQEEIANILSNENMLVINEKIKEIIQRSDIKIKRELKNSFNDILNAFTNDNLKVSLLFKLLPIWSDVIRDLSIVFSEDLSEFMKLRYCELIEDINNKNNDASADYNSITLNNKKIILDNCSKIKTKSLLLRNSKNKNTINIDFPLNLYIFITFYTNEIHQTNHLLTNFIEILNKAIYCYNTYLVDISNIEISNDKELLTIIKCLLTYGIFLINIALKISINSKAYNPNINEILTTIIFTFNKLISSNNQYDKEFNKEFGSSVSELDKLEYSNNNYYQGVLETIDFLTSNLSEYACSTGITLDYLLSTFERILSFYGSENNIKIVFDSILNNSINLLNKLNLTLLKKENKDSKEINNREYFNEQFSKLNSLFIETTKKIVLIKNIPIRFLSIKPKEIVSLEPDWESHEIRDDDEINKSMKKKLQKSKRQMVRNLKKQSKILDEERQKQLSTIRAKRKEDQRYLNKFAEESNLEYKKLMTSQVKKRHKIKHKNHKK